MVLIDHAIPRSDQCSVESHFIDMLEFLCIDRNIYNQWRHWYSSTIDENGHILQHQYLYTYYD